MKLLALRGLLDDAPLDRLKGAQGYKNVAQDLESLVDMLQDNWSRIEGKVLTTRAELEHANRLATRLLRIVGEREHGPEVEITAVSQVRVRAFMVVQRVYENVRRAVAYLRADEGDADVIAPSLHTGRPPRRKATEPVNKGTGTETDPAAAATATGTAVD
ncbi:MAG TPA: hypothetical protein VM686_27230 [Polyangiaceae bacterium]|nr:hypothetical protein [Polyangiaceae bacterium]